jgi:acetolactate synthase-1/2/3 large subunit
LLVGNGVRSADAAELVNSFTEKTKIPVLTTMNAIDVVQDKNKIGFIGTYGNRAANMIIAQCDLLISVGARLGLRQVGHIAENFAPNATLIRVDIDQFELSRTIKEDEQKHLSDAKSFLNNLLAEDIPTYKHWQEICFKVRDTLKNYDREIGNIVIEQISSLLPVNPLVVVDVGQNQCWAAQSLILKGNQGRILICGGYGSMGCSLPMAVGASIANNRSKVYCITGDGGLQMNIQELETVAREKLPIKILVINNYALGKITEIQETVYDSRYAQTTKASGYSVPDFERISTAYNIRATTLNSYEALTDYAQWLYDDEASLINIPIPWNSKLIPKIEFVSMQILPKLDDEVLRSVSEIFKLME